MLKYICFTLIIFLSFPTTTLSQSSQKNKKEKPPYTVKRLNTFSASLTFEGEYLIYYERLFAHNNSFEVGFGRKWSGPLEASRTNNPYLYQGNFYNIAYRHYFKLFKTHALYFSPLFFYKNYSFDHAYIADKGKSDHTYDTQIRSSKKNVLGTKFLLGYKIHLPLSKKSENPLYFVLDFYGGFGLRSKTYKDVIYAEGTTFNVDDCNCPALPEPKKNVPPDTYLLGTSTNGVYPSLHVGMRLGLSF